MTLLEDRLRTVADFKSLNVLGCVRQHYLMGDQPSPWRWVRGNTILAAVADKHTVESPFGYFDIWEVDGWLVQYRGGPTRPWWFEDFRLLTAVVNTYTSLNVKGVAFIGELDGAVSVRYVDGPAETEVEALIVDAVKRWEAKSRIGKSSPRGLAVCPTCPVKRECAALDLEKGETQDWPQRMPWRGLNED